MKRQPSLRWLWRVGATVALGLTFAAYLRPDMAMLAATRLWSCF